jgi:hypothetical protein
MNVCIVNDASCDIDDFESCSIVQLMRWQVGMQVFKDDRKQT